MNDGLSDECLTHTRNDYPSTILYDPHTNEREEAKPYADISPLIPPHLLYQSRDI